MFVEGQDFRVVLGDTWQGSLQVFTDESQAENQDLTDCSCVLLAWQWLDQAPHTLALEPGEPSSGLLSWSWSTQGWFGGTGRWALQITDADGDLFTVAQGSFYANALHQPPAGSDGGGSSTATVVNQIVAGDGVAVSPDPGVGTVTVSVAPPGSVTVPYASTIDLSLPDTVNLLANIGTLTGPCAFGPAPGQFDGQGLMLVLTQDETGGHVPTFDMSFHFGPAVPLTVPVAPGASWRMLFIWSSSKSRWDAVSIVEV